MVEIKLIYCSLFFFFCSLWGTKNLYLVVNVMLSSAWNKSWLCYRLCYEAKTSSRYMLKEKKKKKNLITVEPCYLPDRHPKYRDVRTPVFVWHYYRQSQCWDHLDPSPLLIINRGILSWCRSQRGCVGGDPLQNPSSPSAMWRQAVSQSGFHVCFFFSGWRLLVNSGQTCNLFWIDKKMHF